MRYVHTRYNQHQREWAYRFYIAECNKILVNNVANVYGGITLEASLDDVLNPKPVDSRTGEERVQDFLQKYRGDNF